MVSRCVVPGCRGRKGHRFPLNPARREMWMKAVKWKSSEQPHKRAIVCSSHFKPSDFGRRKGEKRVLPGASTRMRLCYQAVPSVFTNQRNSNVPGTTNHKVNFSVIEIGEKEELPPFDESFSIGDLSIALGCGVTEDDVNSSILKALDRSPSNESDELSWFGETVRSKLLDDNEERLFIRLPVSEGTSEITKSSPAPLDVASDAEEDGVITISGYCASDTGIDEERELSDITIPVKKMRVSDESRLVSKSEHHIPNVSDVIIFDANEEGVRTMKEILLTQIEAIPAVPVPLPTGATRVLTLHESGNKLSKLQSPTKLITEGIDNLKLTTSEIPVPSNTYHFFQIKKSLPKALQNRRHLALTKTQNSPNFDAKSTSGIFRKTYSAKHPISTTDEKNSIIKAYRLIPRSGIKSFSNTKKKDGTRYIIENRRSKGGSGRSAKTGITMSHTPDKKTSPKPTTTRTELINGLVRRDSQNNENSRVEDQSEEDGGLGLYISLSSPENADGIQSEDDAGRTELSAESRNQGLKMGNATAAKSFDSTCLDEGSMNCAVAPDCPARNNSDEDVHRGSGKASPLVIVEPRVFLTYCNDANTTGGVAKKFNKRSSEIDRANSKLAIGGHRLENYDDPVDQSRWSTVELDLVRSHGAMPKTAVAEDMETLGSVANVDGPNSQIIDVGRTDTTLLDKDGVNSSVKTYSRQRPKTEQKDFRRESEGIKCAPTNTRVNRSPLKAVSTIRMEQINGLQQRDRLSNENCRVEDQCDEDGGLGLYVSLSSPESADGIQAEDDAGRTELSAEFRNQGLKSGNATASKGSDSTRLDEGSMNCAVAPDCPERNNSDVDVHQDFGKASLLVIVAPRVFPTDCNDVNRTCPVAKELKKRSFEVDRANSKLAIGGHRLENDDDPVDQSRLSTVELDLVRPHGAMPKTAVAEDMETLGSVADVVDGPNSRAIDVGHTNITSLDKDGVNSSVETYSSQRPNTQQTDLTRESDGTSCALSDTQVKQSPLKAVTTTGMELMNGPKRHDGLRNENSRLEDQSDEDGGLGLYVSLSSPESADGIQAEDDAGRTELSAEFRNQGLKTGNVTASKSFDSTRLDEGSMNCAVAPDCPARNGSDVDVHQDSGKALPLVIVAPRVFLTDCKDANRTCPVDKEFIKRSFEVDRANAKLAIGGHRSENDDDRIDQSGLPTVELDLVRSDEVMTKTAVAEDMDTLGSLADGVDRPNSRTDITSMDKDGMNSSVKTYSRQTNNEKNDDIKESDGKRRDGLSIENSRLEDQSDEDGGLGLYASLSPPENADGIQAEDDAGRTELLADSETRESDGTSCALSTTRSPSKAVTITGMKFTIGPKMQDCQAIDAGDTFTILDDAAQLEICCPENNDCDQIPECGDQFIHDDCLQFEVVGDDSVLDLEVTHTTKNPITGQFVVSDDPNFHIRPPDSESIPRTDLFSSSSLVPDHMLFPVPYRGPDCKQRCPPPLILPDHDYPRLQMRKGNDSSEEPVIQNLPSPLRAENLTCSYCSVDFSSEEILRDHIILQHSDEVFQCPNCNENFNSVWDCNVHTVLCDYVGESTTSHITYLCPQCDFSTKNDSELRGHIDTKHRLQCNHPCPLCPFKCVSESTLQDHMKRYHALNSVVCKPVLSNFIPTPNVSDQPGTMTVRIANGTIQTQNSQLGLHPVSSLMLPSGKVYDSQKFLQKNNLAQPVPRITVRRPSELLRPGLIPQRKPEELPRLLSSNFKPSSKVRHPQSQTNARKRIKCLLPASRRELCQSLPIGSPPRSSSSSASETELNTEIDTRDKFQSTKEPPDNGHSVKKCPECHKICTTYANLGRHIIEFHSKKLDKRSPSHMCHVCKKMFISKTNLDRHIQTTHSVECPECSLFFSKRGIRRHMEKVHKSLCFVCGCKFVTTVASVMQLHMMVVHKKMKGKDAISCPACPPYTTSFRNHFQLAEHAKQRHYFLFTPKCDQFNATPEVDYSTE